MPAVATEGHLRAVRLLRGAVLLDSRRGRIIEIEEEAALALDFVMFGGAGGRDWLDDLANRGAKKALLLGYDEPIAWRGQAHDDAEQLLRLTLVGHAGGDPIALDGPADVVTSVTAISGEPVLPRAEVVVDPSNDLAIREGDDERGRVAEVWSLEVGPRRGLTLVRLSPARSLVKLLFVAPRRPSDATLHALATCAERIPHFLAIVPCALSARTRALTEFFVRRRGDA